MNIENNNEFKNDECEVLIFGKKYILKHDFLTDILIKSEEDLDENKIKIILAKKIQSDINITYGVEINLDDIIYNAENTIDMYIDMLLEENNKLRTIYENIFEKNKYIRLQKAINRYKFLNIVNTMKNFCNTLENTIGKSVEKIYNISSAFSKFSKSLNEMQSQSKRQIK